MGAPKEDSPPLAEPRNGRDVLIRLTQDEYSWLFILFGYVSGTARQEDDLIKHMAVKLAREIATQRK